MAKKVRRVKKKKRSTAVVESTAEKPAEKVASAKEKSAESFRQEYAYVVKDLRRLLLLSGALFLLLIVLNLLLQ
jgi:hypothetical protein